MLRKTWNIIKTTIWLLCQFSGLRLIFRKLIPSTEKAKNKPNYRKPSSFIFWALGTVYLAMFNYVAQQYKDKVDALESRANLIIAQLSNKQNKENDNDIKLYEVNGIRENALAQIAGIQNTLIPFKPKLLSPQSVYKSLYVKEKNSAVINDFKKIIDDMGQFRSQINLNNGTQAKLLSVAGDYADYSAPCPVCKGENKFSIRYPRINDHPETAEHNTKQVGIFTIRTTHSCFWCGVHFTPRLG